MPTKILVFESDAGFAEQLKSGFARLGCPTTVVDDANIGLQAASREPPDLILLSIELPRMNGFSVCNKLKRDPALKDVPLIIMSSDSTEETFEQHRRLRTRAEDYVHKPISFDDLLLRIQPFVSVGLPADADPESESFDEAIVLDDDIEIDEDELVEDTIEPAPLLRENMVDEDVNDFADQAFGALEVPAPPSAPLDSELALEETEPADSEPTESTELERTDPDVSRESLPESTAESADPTSTEDFSRPSLEPGRITQPSETEISEVDEAELSEAPVSLAGIEPPYIPAPAPVARSSARIPSPRPSNLPRAVDLGDTSRYREEAERLRARIKELEDEARAAHAENAELEDALKRGGAKDSEVQRLQRELDDVKAKAAGPARGAGTAREFLDLREQLNKKDKETLETRDQLSHKDKELIGLRESAIALEREKADLHDRIAELEKQAVDLQRATDAAKSDKDQANKRADDFKRKAEKNKADLDARVAELGEARAQHEADLSAHEAHHAALIGDHQAELAQAAESRAAAISAAQEEGRALAEQSANHARAAAETQHAEALLGQQEAAASAQQIAIRARETELKREHDSRLASLHRANEDAMNRLRAEHTQDMTDAEVAARRFLADREEELGQAHEGALEQLRGEKEQSEALRDARHAAVIGDLITTHEAARAQFTEKQSAAEAEVNARTQELAAAHDSITAKDRAFEDLEANLLTTSEELSEVRATLTAHASSIQSLESQLHSAKSELATAKSTISDDEAKLAQGEAALAAAQDDLSALQSSLSAEAARVSRAQAKWSEDRSSLERAKAALGAALAQIEETENRSLD